MLNNRNLPGFLTVAAFLFLTTATLSAQVAPGTSQTRSTIAGTSAADVVAPKPRVMEIPPPPTSATLKLLKTIETLHGHLKTLEADFKQKKTSAAFDQTIESNGKVYLQMPDKLRCDYSNPDPSTTLFVDNASYQVTPKIKQVDKIVYPTKEQAQAQFRLMLLGFGMSTGEVLKNYSVTSSEEKSEKGKPEPVLVFKPIDPDVSDVYKEFNVWLDDQLMPRKVRYEEVSGDVTMLTITRIKKDNPIDEKFFKPSFDKTYEVIEH